MPTSASKAQRIAELEAELAELTKPEFSLLRIFGERKAVVKTTVLSDSQTVVVFNDRPKARRKYYTKRTNGIPVLEYTED